ncbi:MAG: GNAT family protein [Anaerolineae bacterium]|nr:GNAT family protein [Anaerolineae bacterium]
MDIWQGELVRLRGVEPGDAEIHYGWNRDSEMARGVDRAWFPTSKEHVRRWAERAAAQTGEGDEFHFEIENRDGEVVGSINSHHCDPRAGTFSYGVAIRREHQRHGYASEAILLLLRYFFQELRYQKVTVQVASFNEASIHLHEQLGFQHEGRLRRTVFTRGRHYDELVFGMTAEEFEAAHPAYGAPAGT